MLLSVLAGSDGEAYEGADSQTADYEPLKRKHSIRDVIVDDAGATVPPRA